MPRFIDPVPQYILANGNIAAGGKLAFYESGHDTLIDLFADASQSIAIANPVELGSRGEVPNIFYSGSCRVVLQDAEGNQVFDVDPVGSSVAGGNFELWDSNVIYDQLDVVYGQDGQPYISLIPQNEGNDPLLNAGNNPYWSRMVVPQYWNAQVPYSANDLVAVDGTFYKSLIDLNYGIDPVTDGGVNWASLTDARYVVYNNTTSGLNAETGQQAIDEIVNLINNQPSSVVYRGQLDVSGGNGSLPPSPQNGDLYVVAVEGTITVSVAGAAPVSTLVTEGQQIIYNGTQSQWDLISAVQQAAAISYNNATSGLSSNDVQSALDELDADVTAAEDVNTTQNTRLAAIENQLPDFAETSDLGAAAFLESYKIYGVGLTGNGAVFPAGSLDNLTVPSGRYRLTNTAPEFGTRPSGFSVYGYVDVLKYDANTSLQIYTDINNRMAYRSFTSSTLNSWRELYHSGNTNFNVFGAGNTTSTVEVGVGRNTTTVRFYLRLNGTSTPSSISVNGTFNLVDDDFNLVEQVSASNMALSGSNSKIAQLSIILTSNRAQNAARGATYFLQPTDASSSIEVL